MSNALQIIHSIRYLFFALLCVAQLTGLGCSPDPEQRTAYKQFLEDLLPLRPDQALPALTQEQIAAFGNYAESYQALRDFSLQIQESVQSCSRKMAAVSEHVTQPQDLVAHAEELAAARALIAAQPALWEGYLAQLEAARPGFHMHADVSPVYDPLYVKYTKPVHLVIPLLHAMRDFLDSSLELARYLRGNADKLVFQGDEIVFSDEIIQQGANALLLDLNAKAEELSRREDKLNNYLTSGS